MLSPEFLHLLGGYEVCSSPELLGWLFVRRGWGADASHAERKGGPLRVLEPGGLHLA